jgi:hypothetical protein
LAALWKKAEVLEGLKISRDTTGICISKSGPTLGEFSAMSPDVFAGCVNNEKSTKNSFD